MTADAGKPGDERDGYIDQALAAIGGEGTEFYLTARRDGGEGRRIPVVFLSCRYQDCDWGETVGEMELWEFVTDAREHWEGTHASGRITTTPPTG